MARLTTDLNLAAPDDFYEALIAVREKASKSVAQVSTSDLYQTWSGSTTEVPIGSGSGFVWDRSGTVITTCGSWP